MYLSISCPILVILLDQLADLFRPLIPDDVIHVVAVLVLRQLFLVYLLVKVVLLVLLKNQIIAFLQHANLGIQRAFLINEHPHPALQLNVYAMKVVDLLLEFHPYLHLVVKLVLYGLLLVVDSLLLELHGGLVLVKGTSLINHAHQLVFHLCLTVRVLGHQLLVSVHKLFHLTDFVLLQLLRYHLVVGLAGALEDQLEHFPDVGAAGFSPAIDGLG